MIAPPEGQESWGHFFLFGDPEEILQALKGLEPDDLDLAPQKYVETLQSAARLVATTRMAASYLRD